MIEPNDVMKVDDKDWEQFKRDAAKDELFYKGPGDLLDTPEGREKFCRLNETGVFRKPDPDFPQSKIWDAGGRFYLCPSVSCKPHHLLCCSGCSVRL